MPGVFDYAWVGSVDPCHLNCQGIGKVYAVEDNDEDEGSEGVALEYTSCDLEELHLV